MHRTFVPNRTAVAVLSGSVALALLSLGGAAGSTGAGSRACENRQRNVEVAPFGTTPDGEEVHLYKLTNESCMEARIIT
jgi:hypothetical protein